MAVQIQAADEEHGGMRVIAQHFAIATRATFQAGIDDATRQALGVLCHEHAPTLQLSAWKHLPRRESGHMSSVISDVTSMMSASMIAQVRFTAALNAHTDGTAMELQEVREQLDEMRKENQVLRAALVGEDPPAEDEDEEWTLRSPPRRRTRYGSPSIETYIN